MEFASLYVNNVACEMEDAKEVKLTAIGTIKATVIPNLEVGAGRTTVTQYRALLQNLVRCFEKQYRAACLEKQRDIAFEINAHRAAFLWYLVRRVVAP